MAEFSKQYCDRYDRTIPYDFDINVIFDQMKPGDNFPVICEGFGFTHLYINEIGTRQVIFTNWGEDGDDFKFVDYDKLDKNTYKKVWKHEAV